MSEGNISFFSVFFLPIHKFRTRARSINQTIRTPPLSSLSLSLTLFILLFTLTPSTTHPPLPLPIPSIHLLLTHSHLISHSLSLIQLSSPPLVIVSVALFRPARLCLFYLSEFSQRPWFEISLTRVLSLSSIHSNTHFKHRVLMGLRYEGV